MKKISKSSLNGSESGEDSMEKDTNGEKGSLDEEAGNGDDADSVEPEPAEPSDAEDDYKPTKTPPKKRAKALSRKKKVEKDETEGTEASDAEDDNDSIKAPPKKRAKARGTTKKQDEEYEVEKVVGAKKVKGKQQYLIRWKGYSSDNDTWEPAKTVSCPDLITKYEEEQKKSKAEKKTPKKSLKRKAGKKKDTPPAKKLKNKWDSEDAEDDAEYEVDKILEVHHKKNKKREFLIHWKGWASKFDSWEPEEHLNCPDLIEKFMDKVENAKSADSHTLRVAPGSTKRFTLQAPSSGRRLSKRRGQKQRVRYDDAE